MFVSREVVRSASSAAEGTEADGSPLVVIDERGHEVGVVVEYREYLALLGVLAVVVGREALPPYWRGALDDCLSQPGRGETDD